MARIVIDVPEGVPPHLAASFIKWAIEVTRRKLCREHEMRYLWQSLGLKVESDTQLADAPSHMQDSVRPESDV